MNGATPDALAKMRNKPNINNKPTMGIIHQSFRSQSIEMTSPATLKFVTIPRKKFNILHYPIGIGFASPVSK